MFFFFLDCMFVTQIYLNDDGQLSLIARWILFNFGVFFVILPLIVNLTQLHNKIQVWVTDTYSKHTVQAWMRSYLRMLYMITILSGSAFAAVDICNSNIFHISLFNMGLNQRQQAMFKNQRILSIVLMENIPQLILQVIYLSLTKESSISSITIVAMIFSTLSIILSLFNYKSSSLLLQCEAITLIEMEIQSRQLSHTKPKKFQKLIVHHRKPICRELGKIVHVDERLIEILMPIQTKTGAELTFYIRNDSSDKNLGSNIVKTIRNEIESKVLAQVKCWGLVHCSYCVRFVRLFGFFLISGVWSKYYRNFLMFGNLMD